MLKLNVDLTAIGPPTIVEPKACLENEFLMTLIRDDRAATTKCFAFLN